MKSRRCWAIVLGAAALLASSQALAATVNLFEYAFKVDGTLSDSLVPDPIPPQVTGGFNPGTGFGTIIFTITGAGSHYAGLFVDPEIDQTINTFFNEVGSAVGAPLAGQSWEIDEPGYVFGDIFARFTAGILDNTVGTTSPDDVSLALAWNFNLAAGETATASFVLDSTVPAGGFYLRQNDPNSNFSLYLRSTLAIGQGPGPGPDPEPRHDPVPEPGTLALLGAAVCAAWGSRRTMIRKTIDTAPRPSSSPRLAGTA